MHTARVTLKSITPYSSSRPFTESEVPKDNPKETPGAYDERTWKHKVHLDPETGNVIIPAQQFLAALRMAASYDPIKKRGAATFTKNIKAGVQMLTGLDLGIKPDALQSDTALVRVGKNPGAGSVYRRWPRVDSWGGIVEFQILDDNITQEIFRKTLETAGLFIGIGRWRPSAPTAPGPYGRFEVKAIKWIAA